MMKPNIDKVEIVTCLVTDEEARAYLVHRRDHKNWQFPGGRQLATMNEHGAYSLETPETAAARILDHTLMIHAEPHMIRRAGTLVLESGLITTEAQMMEVPYYSGDAVCVGFKNYDYGEFVDLHRLNLRRSLSPTVEAFVQKLHDREVALLPRDTVQ